MTRSKTLLALLLAALIGVGGLSLAPAQDKKDDKGGATIEIYKDKSEEFRFRIKEGDVTLAIASKGYKTKADVDKVIATLQKDVAKAKVIDDTKK